MTVVRRGRVDVALNGFFFVFAGAAALWLRVLAFSEALRLGWWAVPALVVFWALLAYLVLPRLTQVLTAMYVPD